MASQDAAAAVVVDMNNHAANEARNYPTNFVKTSKYNIITFLPLNLFHQFRKVSNFYFLVNMIIALLPGVSPISPYTAVVPLVFVLGVALIKDGYEDFLRHKADNAANSIHAQVVRKGPSGAHELVTVESRDVAVGDIMFLQNGDELRADVLLFSTSEPESQAFIETCNLDGETNLKNRKGAETTWRLNSLEACTGVTVSLQTGPPSPALLSWTGLLVVDGVETAVGLDQFLYRSCILKNTASAWGMVIYAGVDTKMFRNLQEKPPKMSNLDYKLNKLIVGVLCVQIALLLIMSGLAVDFTARSGGHWYMRYYLDQQTGGLLFLYRMLTYFILMSYLIPISLFVTIELCKVAQGLLMRFDHEMMEWMNHKWTTCVPNTTNLNEQLAQVKFIFTDKTGTLTENVMRYLRGDIIGLPVDINDMAKSQGYLKDTSTREQALTYFRSLALCHTINPFPDPHNPGAIHYDGSSPDEIALVRIAVEHDCRLTERATRSITILVEGNEEKYEILSTLEFTPDRKMMSIILRTPQKKIVMFTKGADSFVKKRIDPEANKLLWGGTDNVLRDMATLGLRTLVVCKKDIAEADYNAWLKRFTEAGKALSNRSQIVDEVCLEMEKDLIVIGVTAIEDKLQDQVPETLRFFLKAGVIVWMLTGDKRETAVTIAATSSLANPQEDVISHIDIGEPGPRAPEIVLEQLKVIKQHCDASQSTGKKVTFVVDGPALEVCMQHQKELFLEVSQRVASAVCCRLTPLQKASVVNMFQTSTGTTALAIGDGANDVSMIQEGRVGVGIVGLEGAQAALAADYAIPRFKHLRRLCAVHGRYALYRNALCVCFSFYKNIMMSLTQFYFSFFAGFSGTTLFDGWLLSFFNIAFTSMPPLMLGIFEKDLHEQALLESPELFPFLSKGLYFDTITLSRWFGQALLHSLALFFIILPTITRQDVLSNQVMDGLMVGSILMSCVILMALSKLMLHIKYWQGPQIFGFVFSYVFFFIFVLAYSAIPNLFSDTTFYYTYYILLADPKYWLYLFLFVIGMICPIDMAVLYLQKTLFPTARDSTQLRYASNE